MLNLKNRRTKMEKRKLSPTQVASNYGPVPSDPNIYMDQSRMKDYPEVTLWNFLEERPDIPYEKWAMDIGSDLTTEHDAKVLTNLDINQQDWLDFMINNKETCQKKAYERRPYHNGVSDLTMDLPMKAGYNHRNTVEYNWGLYGDSNKKIKDMLGSRKVWEDTIGIDYDTALCRLLAYLPGNTLPWHDDNLGNWCRDNANLNPNMDTGMCDLGPIKRYLVMITDWHWGHVLQFQNSFFPKWKSGEVYDLPMYQPHCSTNMGIRLKLTCSISGAKIK
jgi:hypothetical protein